jgi:[CysO sulfur-carrier protein]-S-L-cysteine hydrolase
MMNLILPVELKERITKALLRAGHREIGGVLMGEHVGNDSFKVTSITIQQPGTVSRFIRRIEEAVGSIKKFFKSTEHNYSRFNYIGEWHSHPLFEPIPSFQDDASMLDLITDGSLGANFVVLLIVKLDANQSLIGTAHTYLPSKTKSKAVITIDTTNTT